MNPAQPKRRLLPNLGLPQPVVIGLAVVIVLIIVILIYGLAFGSKNDNSTSLTGLAARAQEIARVSDLAAQDSQDSSLQALAGTVSAAMTSQEAQLNAYQKQTGQKVDPKTLAAAQNPATDQLLQTATQNNNLESTYTNYLSASLGSYKTELADEYQKASNPNLKAILNDATASVQTIIGSLKSQ